MKKINKLNFLFLFISVCSFLSCSDKDIETEPISKSKHNFVMLTKVGQSTYLGSFADLDHGDINTSNSYEHKAGGALYFCDNFVFYAEGLVGNKIYKYKNTAEGGLEYISAIEMPENSMPGEICFLNMEKAYVSLHGLGKIAIINPTSLEIIGEIDLREYAVEDNNPDPGVSIIRDGKLFIALNQKKSAEMVHHNAYVAVIDVKTDIVEKVIVDERVSSIGTFNHTKVISDEDGNIYFYGNAMFGFQKGAKEGFLRIKKGSTDWDKDYYCSLKAIELPGVLGNRGAYTLALAYGGHGDVYMDIQIPALLAGKMPDFVNLRDYQPFKVNIFNNTAEKIDLPPTAGWSAWGICIKGDEVIFALSTKTANGLYVYNNKTKKCTSKPIANVAGMPGYINYMFN